MFTDSKMEQSESEPSLQIPPEAPHKAVFPETLIHMYIYMSARPSLARTIAISDDVYELLKRSKLPNESFSAVIRRSLKRGKLSEIAGSHTLSTSDWRKTKRLLLESDARGRRKMTERL